MSSSELSSISSQSEVQSSSSSETSSQQESKREYIDKRKRKSNNKFSYANSKRIQQLRKSQSHNSDPSSTTSIIHSQRKKSIKFNLSNQEINLDEESAFQQRVNRGRRKSRFSKTDFLQEDVSPFKSLQMRRQNSQQLIMKRKTSEGEYQNYPQSILKKSSFERSKSMIESPVNIIIDSNPSPKAQRHNQIPSLEFIVNESNPSIFQNFNSPLNQILFRKNSQFSTNIFPQDAVQSFNENQNDYAQLPNINNNKNESENNFLGDNIRYRPQRLPLENINQQIRLQLPNNLNISDISQQNNSNQSLNNFYNANNVHTPNNRNTNQLNSQQPNNSVQTPSSQRNSKNLNLIENAYGNIGFSDLVLQYTSNSTQAYSNPNLPNSIGTQGSIHHRSPSQQFIINKKKDYQEVLKELVDTQERLRVEEEKNEYLSNELKKKQEKNNALMKQQEILLKKSSYKKSVLREMNQKLNSMQNCNKLVAIYVPFNQQIISKINKMYTLMFYETIFLSQNALKRQPFFCQNSFQYVKNSIYIYNLLVINSLLSFIVAPSIFMEKTNDNKIESFFYSAYDASLISQIAFQIFTTILVITIAHLVNLSNQKRQYVRAKSKGIHKMSLFKLVFNSYDFKESISEQQVDYYKQIYSSTLKQYIKKNIKFNSAVAGKSLKTQQLLGYFILFINAGIIISALFILQIILSIEYSKYIFYQGAVLSLLTIGMSELVMILLGKLNDLPCFNLDQNNLKKVWKIQSVSFLILSCYFVISTLNLVFQKQDLSFFASIKTSFNFIQSDPNSNQLQSQLQIECPEKILSLIMIQYTMLLNAKILIKNVVRFLKNKLFHSHYQKQSYKKSQSFDFYENQLGDCLIFLLITINQSFFLLSNVFGLLMFMVKFLINYMILRNSKVLNFSHYQSFQIQNRFNSDFTFVLVISILYQFILNQLSYQKFFDKNGQVCGPFQGNQNISSYIYENLFTQPFTQQIYQIITWPPLLWTLLLSYLMRQQISNFSGSEWKIEKKNQGKMMKEVNKHYQQKLQNLEVKIKNTQTVLVSSQNFQINRIQ
ncbi:hypothetical protein ABPG72_007974 [Tetrahymena utriculariae]